MQRVEGPLTWTESEEDGFPAARITVGRVLRIRSPLWRAFGIRMIPP